MKVLSYFGLRRPKAAKWEKVKMRQRKMRSIRKWYLAMLAATSSWATKRHNIFLESTCAWPRRLFSMAARKNHASDHDLPSSLLSPMSHWSITFNFWVSFHHLVPSLVVWKQPWEEKWLWSKDTGSLRQSHRETETGKYTELIIFSLWTFLLGLPMSWIQAEPHQGPSDAAPTSQLPLPGTQSRVGKGGDWMERINKSYPAHLFSKQNLLFCNVELLKWNFIFS